MGENSKGGKGRLAEPVSKTCDGKLDPKSVKFEDRKPIQQLKYFLNLLLTKGDQTPEEIWKKCKAN